MVAVYDDLAGTVAEPVRLCIPASDDLEVCEFSWADLWGDGSDPAMVLFVYELPLDGPPADDGAAFREHTNTAWVTDPDEPGPPPAPCLEDDPLCAVAEANVYAFDVALRSWVSEVYRDGERVWEFMREAGSRGPADPIAYSKADYDFDIRAGDVIVQRVAVFNQGWNTIRLTDVRAILSPGQELLDCVEQGAVPGWDCLTDDSAHGHGRRIWSQYEGWAYANPGEMILRKDFLANPSGYEGQAVLGPVDAPDGQADIYIAYLITQVGDLGEADSRELYTFFLVYSFDGWVIDAYDGPENQECPVFDGSCGHWSQDVVDIDSIANSFYEEDFRVPVDETGALMASGVGDCDSGWLWVDNAIHHGHSRPAEIAAGIVSLDTGPVFEVYEGIDQDHHDGNIKRAFSALYVPGGEEPPGGEPPAGGGTPPDSEGAPPNVNEPRPDLPITGAVASLALLALAAVALGARLVTVRRRRLRA